jgi:hypothetical protein
MCFGERVPDVLRACVKNDKMTVVDADAKLNELRLNPTTDELCRVLLPELRRGWSRTFWERTSECDGFEIHVTIWSDAIKRPGLAIDTFSDKAKLCDALFKLGDDHFLREVHATLNVVVAGEDGHPAVYFCKKDKYWSDYERYLLDLGEPRGVARERRIAARRAVVALLDEYIALLRRRCQMLIDNIRNGCDIAGNRPK